MSDNNDQEQRIAETIVRYIDPYLQQQTQEAVNSIAAQKEEFENFVRRTSDELAKRFAAGVSEVSSKAISNIQSAGHEVNNSIGESVKRLESTIELANSAASEAREEAERSAHLREEAIAAEQSANEEKERAQRATATLTMQTETMVNRLTAEAEFERKKRETEAQLEAEEQSLQDEYDAKESWIQRQVMEMVPQVAETLNGIVEEEGDVEGKEPEDV